MERNNYVTKTVNAYIVKDLLKNGLFGATNIVKKSDKEKYNYSSYEKAFDGEGELDFGNGFAKNVAKFGDTLVLIEVLVQEEKKLVLIFVKEREFFALVSFTMVIIVICLLRENKFTSLKQTLIMSTFDHMFSRTYI